MRDSAGPALDHLLKHAHNLDAEQRRIAFVTAEAADTLPPDRIDYSAFGKVLILRFNQDGPEPLAGGGGLADQLDVIDHEEKEKRREKWAEAMAEADVELGQPLWRGLDRYADLEPILNDLFKLSPKKLFRRFVQKVCRKFWLGSHYLMFGYVLTVHVFD